MDQIPEHQTAYIQNLINEIEHHLLPEAAGQFSRCQNYRIFRAYFNVRIILLKRSLATVTGPHIHQQQQVAEPSRPKEQQNRTDETMQRQI